jgi:hypothetical protein
VTSYAEMNLQRRKARALYLELVALGINTKTGYVPELNLESREIESLMRRVKNNRAGLREVFVGDTLEFEAIREEGAARE